MNPGSGRWTFPKKEKEEMELLPDQLYNMNESWKETDNLEAKYPKKVAELKKLLKETIENGRSTEGPPQTNVEDFIPATIKWMDKQLNLYNLSLLKLAVNINNRIIHVLIGYSILSPY